MIPDIAGTRGHDHFGQYVKRDETRRRFKRRLTRPDPLAALATNRAGIDHDR